MERPHRIAAGGLTFKDDSVLLVRYRDAKGGTFLVGPGGALAEQENIVQAIVRETSEETGVVVRPQGVVIIEDLLCSRYKMSKVWMISDFLGGHVQTTEAAEKEDIIEAGWFSRAQLTGEVVYPTPLMQHDWSEFRRKDWQVICLPHRRASF